jgi:hypothetical protein
MRVRKETAHSPALTRGLVDRLGQLEVVYAREVFV